QTGRLQNEPQESRENMEKRRPKSATRTAKERVSLAD
ncbi:unnamed protein product, partial [marine sediment metagenome]